MANSRKMIAVLQSPQTAGPSSRWAETRYLRSTPSSSDSSAPQLDRLVDELEAAFGAALTGELSAPAPSRSSSPMSDSFSAGDVHERTPSPEGIGDGGHSEDRSFEGVLDGDEWAVHLPENKANAEARSPSTVGVGQTEAVDRREAMAPQSGPSVHRTRRWGGRLLRQVAIPGAILIPLAIGAVSLAVVTPGILPTAVEGEDVPKGDGLPASIGDNERDELGRATIDDSAVRDAQLSEPQEPITPRLVKTVPVYERSDQPTVALPPPELPAVGQLDRIAPEQGKPGEMPGATSQRSIEAQAIVEPSGARWSDSAVANASLADRLQVETREPARTDEALSETEPHATEPNRWPNTIDVEDNAQPGDIIAAAGQADGAELPHDPVEPATDPTPGTAYGVGRSAAETDDSSVSATTRPAEPTRFAAATTDVNMRAGPTNRAAVVTVVPAGGRIGVIGCSAWCEVVFESERGWIHSSFVGGGSAASGVGAATADLQIAAGTPLVSADGAQLGTVRGQTTDDDGQVFFLIELAQELGAAVPSMWLRKEHFVSAGDQARVRFTRARLLRSLPSQSGAEASRGTDAS